MEEDISAQRRDEVSTVDDDAVIENLEAAENKGMSEESSLDISAEDCDVNLSKDLALSASSCDEQVPATDNELVEAEDQMTSELTTGSGEPMVKTEDNVWVSDIEAKSPANDSTDRGTSFVEDEPKDIEIEYDDTTVAIVSPPSQFGMKNVNVRLPNFVYTNKHLNASGRFKVQKLIHSHPVFFKKKPKKKASLAKSMGGGFTVKSDKMSSRKPKKEEWVKSKKEFATPKTDVSLPIKEELAKKTEESSKKGAAKTSVKSGLKTFSKAVVDSEESSEDEKPNAPSLKEVTIRNLKVEIERLHENIVKFKYKQYKEFNEMQNQNCEKKTKNANKVKVEAKVPVKDNKSKNAAKGTTPKTKPEKSGTIKSPKVASRLFEKFGIDTDASSDEDGNKPSPKEKSKTPAKGAEKEPAKIQARKRSSTAKEKSVSKDDSDGEGSDKDTSVVANPFFSLSEPPEKETQENEKEKLVEMLFSLIKGSKVVDTVVKQEKEVSDKPTQEAVSESIPLVIAAEECEEKIEESSVKDVPTQVSDDNEPIDKPSSEANVTSDPFESLLNQSKNVSVGAVSTVTPAKPGGLERNDYGEDDDAMDFDAGFDDREASPPPQFHSDHEEKEAEPEKLTPEKEKEPKKTFPDLKLTVDKSSEVERRKFLVPNVFRQCEEMKQLQEVLILHTTHRARLQGSQTLSLGDLEDIVAAALENIKEILQEIETDKVARNKQDMVTLKQFKMQPTQVNIKNIRKKEKHKSSFSSAMKALEKQKLDKNIYLWDPERKSRSIHNSLSIAKQKYARARHISSSSSSDDSPERSRPRDPSPSPPRTSKNVSIGRKLEDSDSDNANSRASSEQKESSKKKAEIKRARDEKRAQDPNRFKIPKKEKPADKTTMKAILEEGLKKVNSSTSSTPTSANINRQGRYHDWRKEQRIKEVRKKEKFIDLKKIEDQSSKPTTTPNYMDNILSSMDKITKKPEQVKKSDSKEPLKEVPEVPSAEELEIIEKKKEERELEKIRQMEKRRKDLDDAKVEVSRPHLEDLTSDEWGSSVTTNTPNKALKIFKPSLSSFNDNENSDDELPEPVSAVADAKDEQPTAAKMIPPSPKSLLKQVSEMDNKGSECENNAEEPVEDYVDDYYDDGGGDFDDYEEEANVPIVEERPSLYKDRNQTKEPNQKDQTEKPKEAQKDRSRVKESQKRDRSRTPSPFLRTNRYYPEFYAKKSQKKPERVPAPAALPSARIVPTVPTPVPAPGSRGVPAPVPVPLPPSVSTPVPLSLQNVKFPSDIDQRIAKHFRDKRSREETKKSKRKDSDAREPWQADADEQDSHNQHGREFEIDTNDSFMSNQSHAFTKPDESRTLGSRLSGAGLGLFINKVISSLKGKGKSSSLPKPSAGNDDPNHLLPPPPPFSIPPPPPTSHNNGPLATELEPGELPDSPKRSKEQWSNHEYSPADYDDQSTIHVQEADLDESMILEIVGELDDTLEEEEKLLKAKEKLAKHLLKKKSALASTWEGNMNNVDRRQSVRKMMMMQLPNNGKQQNNDIMQNIILPPPPPPSVVLQSTSQPRHLPPPPPPPQRPPLLPEYGGQEYEEMEDEDQNVDSFASQWGCDDNQRRFDYQEEEPEDEEYSSAISKLRGNRNPKSMSSALEKLRSMKRRTILDSPFFEPDPKRGRMDHNNFPPSIGSVIDNLIDDENVINPMFSMRNKSSMDGSPRDRPGYNVLNNQRGANFNPGMRSNLPTQRFNLTNDQDAQNYQMNCRPWESNAPRRINNLNPEHISEPSVGPDLTHGRFQGPSEGNWDNQRNDNLDSTWNRDDSWRNTPPRDMRKASPPRGFNLNGGFRRSQHADNYSNATLEDETSNSLKQPGEEINLYEDQLRKRITTATEREYLERFAFQWSRILENDFPKAFQLFMSRLNEQKSANGVVKESEDLGSSFNDMRLNLRVVNPTGGEMDVFGSSVIDGVLQFKCEICNISVLGKRNIESHLTGKKHKAKMEDYKIVENSMAPRTKPVKSVLSIKDHGVLSSLLPLYKAAPLIGVQFIVEVLAGDEDPEYHCLLCKFKSGPSELMFHLLSAEHRLCYLDKYFPSVRMKFSRVPNRRFWEIPTYEFLDSVINRIEFKFGRCTPFISENSEMFEKNKSLIHKTIETSDYPRESEMLNFASLPDPFGAYIGRIPRHQING